MQLLFSMLDDLKASCAEGKEYSSFSSLVRGIDIRTNIILKALDFDPSDRPHAILFNKGEEERLAEAKRVNQQMEENPAIALPQVITAYCRSIGNLVREELLAFATDFQAGPTFRFTISFSSFASVWASDKQETENQRIQKKLQQMANAGYRFGNSKRKEHIILDCDENRLLLENFCKEHFGAEPWEIHSHHGVIRKLDMSIKYTDFTPAAPDKKQEEPDTGLMTADEAIQLAKLVSDVKFALSSYQMMKDSGSGNLPLGCVQSYVYHMEQITRVHASIWEKKEKEYQDSRKKNQEIRDLQESVGSRAVTVLQDKIHNMLSDGVSCLNALANKLGFYADSLTLGDYGLIRFVFSPNSMLFHPLDIQLDGIMLERDSCFYVKDTDENRKKILQTVQQYVPHAELESYGVHLYQGMYHLRDLSFCTQDSSDFCGILEIPIPNEDT